jgi:hypothetical protein
MSDFLLPGKTKAETEAALAKMPGLKKLVDNSIAILKGENDQFVNGQSIAAHALTRWGAPDWAILSGAYQEYVSMESGRMAAERAEIALSQIAGTLLTALATLGNVTALTANSMRLLIEKTNASTRRLTKAVDTVLAVEIVGARNELAALKKQLDSVSSNTSTAPANPQTPAASLLTVGGPSGLNMGLASTAVYNSDRRFRVFIELPSGSPSAIFVAAGTVVNTVVFGVPRVRPPMTILQPVLYPTGVSIFPPDGVAEVAPSAPSPSTGVTDLQGFDIMFTKDHKYFPGEITFIDVTLID